MKNRAIMATAIPNYATNTYSKKHFRRTGVIGCQCVGQE